MQFIRPSFDLIVNFIYWTHKIERTELSFNEIHSCYKSKSKVKNPNIDGHYKAIGYIFDMIDKDFFPTKSILLINNIQKSEAALFWLKEMHFHLADPLMKSAIMIDDFSISKSQIGKYRTTEEMLTTRLTPHHSLIPALMHIWINDLAKLHIPIADKVKQPYGITKEKAKELSDFAYETQLLFSCVMPFKVSSNKFARLLENALRLQWRLPWKVTSDELYNKFIQDVQKFQAGKLDEYIKRSQDIKF
jgi:hypothetical protein